MLNPLAPARYGTAQQSVAMKPDGSGKWEGNYVRFEFTFLKPRSPDLTDVPVVALCICATFLKPEMLHIYRQITSLRRIRPVVIAQKRENAERFPFQNIRVVKKPAPHFLATILVQTNCGPAMANLVPRSSRGLARAHGKQAELLHIYFGHIAMLLRPLIRQWQKPSLVSFHGADVLVDMEKPAYRRATEEMLSLVRRVLVRSESLRARGDRSRLRPGEDRNSTGRDSAG